MTSLFDPLRVGDLTLSNRVILAPLTRMRSRQPGNIPWELNAEYYAQRASAGLIISEATQIAPLGQGYPGTPGIHTDEQVAGWRHVTDAVHRAGGLMFLQLWHVGRISHSSFHPDEGLPVAPSAVKPSGEVLIADWTMAPYETPRALETDEIPGVIAQYAAAAQRAKEAGFDGVEVHAANGYLLDQFLQDGSNLKWTPISGQRFKLWSSLRIGTPTRWARSGSGTHTALNSRRKSGSRPSTASRPSTRSGKPTGFIPFR